MTHSLLQTPRLRARRGLSLIELMVAVSLLAIVLLSVARLVPGLSRLGMSNDIILKRSYVIQQQVSKYQAMPFDSVYARRGTTTTRVFSLGTVRISRAITVTDSSGKVEKIKIKVTPNGKVSLADSVTIYRGQPATSLLCTTASC